MEKYFYVDIGDGDECLVPLSAVCSVHSAEGGVRIYLKDNRSLLTKTYDLRGFKNVVLSGEHVLWVE